MFDSEVRLIEYLEPVIYDMIPILLTFYSTFMEEIFLMHTQAILFAYESVNSNR